MGSPKSRVMNALLRNALAAAVSASSCTSCMTATNSAGYWCGGNTCYTFSGYNSCQVNGGCSNCQGFCSTDSRRRRRRSSTDSRRRSSTGSNCQSLCTGSCGPCKKDSSKWGTVLGQDVCCSSSDSCGSCCECGGFIGGMVALGVGPITICVLLCCYFCTCCPWYKRRTQQQTFNSGTAVAQTQM